MVMVAHVRCRSPSTLPSPPPDFPTNQKTCFCTCFLGLTISFHIAVCQSRGATCFMATEELERIVDFITARKGEVVDAVRPPPVETDGSKSDR